MKNVNTICHNKAKIVKIRTKLHIVYTIRPNHYILYPFYTHFTFKKVTKY